MTIAERIAEIKARAEAATPGPWTRTFKPGRDESRAWLLGQFDASDGDGVHGAGVGAPGKTVEDECLSTAVTGNGPTSEANAVFIVAARTDVPFLCDQLERALELLRDAVFNPDDCGHAGKCRCKEIAAFLNGAGK